MNTPAPPQVEPLTDEKRREYAVAFSKRFGPNYSEAQGYDIEPEDISNFVHECLTPLLATITQLQAEIVRLKESSQVEWSSIKNFVYRNLHHIRNRYWTDDEFYEAMLKEYPKSDLVRLARPPAPNGNGTTVGVQPVARISKSDDYIGSLHADAMATKEAERNKLKEIVKAHCDHVYMADDGCNRCVYLDCHCLIKADAIIAAGFRMVKNDQ